MNHRFLVLVLAFAASIAAAGLAVVEGFGPLSEAKAAKIAATCLWKRSSIAEEVGRNFRSDPAVDYGLSYPDARMVQVSPQGECSKLRRVRLSSASVPVRPPMALVKEDRVEYLLVLHSAAGRTYTFVGARQPIPVLRLTGLEGRG